MMTEVLVHASPVAGFGAGLAASVQPSVLGPMVVAILGLIMLGWFVRQVFFKQVPFDTTPDDPRAAGDHLTRERFHPRASDLLPRSPRHL
jgi:hypothetical protein